MTLWLRNFLLQILFLGGAFALGLVACEALFSTNVAPRPEVGAQTVADSRAR